MSGAEQADVLARFIGELNAIWNKAGTRSLTEVEALSRRFATPVQARTLRVVELKRSTLQRILAGRGRQLPSWQWVASLVTVLRVVASQNGVDPDDLGTLAEWKTRHEQAGLLLGQRRAGAPAPADCADDDTASRAVHRGARSCPTSRTRTGPHRADPHGQDGQAALRALAQRSAKAGWWHQYRDVVPPWIEVYLDLEQAARRVRVYEPQFVPGLLQTQDYAEAVIRLEHGTAPRAQVNRRVQLRMLRQRRLWGPNPPQVWAILDETVLHRQFGAPATMRAQFEHLLRLASRPNVRIQVMPLSKGGYAAAGGPITDLRFAEEELPDVVCLEQLTKAEYPAAPLDVVHFGQVLDRLAVEAEDPTTTRTLLRRMCTNP